jgi:hypothetical protein
MSFDPLLNFQQLNLDLNFTVTRFMPKSINDFAKAAD